MVSRGIYYFDIILKVIYAMTGGVVTIIFLVFLTDRLLDFAKYISTIKKLQVLEDQEVSILV